VNKDKLDQLSLPKQNPSTIIDLKKDKGDLVAEINRMKKDTVEGI